MQLLGLWLLACCPPCMSWGEVMEWKLRRSATRISRNVKRMKGLRQMLKPIALLILLAGCSGSGHESECAPWRPLRVSREDVLSEPLARSILSHNLTGQRICGW